MRLRSISLRNYRRYRSVDLELPDGMVSIIGTNGSGKSTLLEAFAWALFGNQTETVRTGKESIKRQEAAHTEPCSVRIEFDYEDTAYTVERSMKGKNLTMSAEMHAGGTLMARGTDDVSEALIKLFGMDHKSFFISVFARQTELNALTSQPKGDRKKLVLRLLDIESVDEAIKQIREDSRLAKTSVESARAELRAPDGTSAVKKAEADIATVSADSRELAKSRAALEREIADKETVQGKLKKEMAKLEKLAKEKNSLDSAAAAHRRECSVLDSQRKELAAELKKHEPKEAEFSQLEPRAAKFAEELESVLGKRKEAAAERDSIRTGMADLKAGIRQLLADAAGTETHMKEVGKLGPDSDCPTCKRQLGKTYGTLLAEYQSQTKEKERAVKASEKKLAESEAKLADCEGRSGALEKQETRIREKIAKSDRLRMEAEQASNLRKRLRASEGKLAESKAELGRITEKLEALDFDDKSYARSKEALESLALEIRASDREMARLNVEMARNSERLSNLEAALKRLKDMERKHADQEARVQVLTALEDVMGQFRTYLISKIRPALSSASSELLGVLTEGKYSEIRLDEDYEISILDAGQAHPLDRFSGGEKDLANLCLRLAISEIIATRHGTSSFDMIVLDEIFGSQDSNRKRILLSTLSGLSNRFKQIFLITHVEDIKELMGNVIQVTENADGTSSARVM